MNKFSRPLSTGTYKTTDTFKSIPEHVAVMFDDDCTLVAVTGALDDEKNVQESKDYAELFSVAPQMAQELEKVVTLMIRCVRFIYANTPAGVEHILAVDCDNLRCRVEDLLEKVQS